MENTVRYLIFAALSAVLMGTMGPIAKYANLGAETITFYRLFFGSVMMLIYLATAGKIRKIICRPSWQVVASGVLLSAFIVCYIQAMNYTSMANTIVTAYLAPIVASIVAHFAFSEKLNRQSVILILFALFGFIMMREFKLDFASDSGGRDSIGMGFALLAMLFYSGYILLNRLIPDRVHVLSRSWYQLTVGALCVLPLMLMKAEPIALPQWGWLVCGGLFPGFLAILFAVTALYKLPAATFGTLAYLEPVVVVVLGWGLFGECLNSLQIAGCIVIIAAGVLRAMLPQP
jgi:drug/metabolite transporter (DMT)-like permease